MSASLAGKSIAYFSAEFALHQSLPIYAGGLGVLAGDHCKEASDLGVPLIGVGFMYPQGYFHQSVSADGWQEEIYEKLNWTGRGDRAGDDARRQAVHHGGAARQPHGAGRRVARAGRPREAVSCSTPISRRTRRGIASCRRASTAATAKRASSRKSSSASAACACSRRMGIEPGRLSPQRGPRRVRRAAAHPRPVRARRQLRRGARRSAPDDGVHDPHAGGRRPRRVSVPAGGNAPRRRLGRPRRLPRAVLRARPLRQRRRPDVQHDGAGAAHGRRGQRRQPAARRSHQADVAVDLARHAVRRAAGQVAHQRRPRADVDVGGDRRAARAAPRPRLAGASRRSGVLRRRAADSRRGAVGGAAVAARVPLQLHPRARAPALDDRGHRRGARSSPPARCSITTR